MKYIFINPVVANMYKENVLEQLLSESGYKRVNVENDWHAIVKEKYTELKKNNKDGIILDRRCPAAFELANKFVDNQKVVKHEINPILIHCGIEVSEREELKGSKKVITTPCKSLADYGNSLNLEDTEFISWNDFFNRLNKDIPRKILDESPIPLGYFTSTGLKTSSLSGKENIQEHFTSEDYSKYELIEMLYCTNGCNNGDGVLINE